MILVQMFLFGGVVLGLLLALDDGVDVEFSRVGCAMCVVCLLLIFALFSGGK